MTADAISVVNRFVESRHPTADAAILAGSRSRGQEAPGSDYDVVLLFRSLPDGAWRAMTMFEERHIEVFAHDPATLAYFFQNVDRPSGLPVLQTMITEGVAVVAHSQAILEAAKASALQALALGPEVLDAATLQARRFAISDLAAAIQPDRAKHVIPNL